MNDIQKDMESLTTVTGENPYMMDDAPSSDSSPSACSEFRLPVVAGRRSSMSNADFERACLVHIERLQCGLGLYDSAMMSTFCEAVRMVREYSDSMRSRNPNSIVVSVSNKTDVIDQ